jgi:hypothetical protein
MHFEIHWLNLVIITRLQKSVFSYYSFSLHFYLGNKAVEQLWLGDLLQHSAGRSYQTSNLQVKKSTRSTS